MNSPVDFKVHQLKNASLELSLLPEFGCLWTRLRTAKNKEWLDLLFPEEDLRTLSERPSCLGSYLMAPWGNRIPGGMFEFEGKRHKLRLNFPDGTAIHGDVRKRPWRVQSASSSKFIATLDAREFKDFNYPYPLRFTHTLELSAARLSVSLRIENMGSTNAPVGFGYHPFFKRRLTKLDRDVVLILPAGKIYPQEKCIPTAPAVSVDSKTDLRQEKFLGNPNLDHGYTTLASDKIRLMYPGSRVEIAFKLEKCFNHVVIYAPNDDNGIGKDFFAVEPMTHAVNALNFFSKDWKETGLKVLAPGESWGGRMDIEIKNS